MHVWCHFIILNFSTHVKLRDRDRKRERKRDGIKVSGKMRGGGGAGLPAGSVGGLCGRRGKQAQMEVAAYPSIWSSAPLSEHDGSENNTDICLIHCCEFVSVSVQTAVTGVKLWAG